MLERINSAIDYIFTRVDKKPKVGIILGSGLGNLSTEIENPINIPYEQIPNFPVGHARSIPLLRRVDHESSELSHSGFENAGHRSVGAFQCSRGYESTLRNR